MSAREPNGPQGLPIGREIDNTLTAFLAPSDITARGPRSVAWARVDDQCIKTKPSHDATHDLCRLLVAHGISDRPICFCWPDGRPRLTFGSIARSAELTVRFVDTRGYVLSRWISPEIKSRELASLRKQVAQPNTSHGEAPKEVSGTRSKGSLKRRSTPRRVQVLAAATAEDPSEIPGAVARRASNARQGLESQAEAKADADLFADKFAGTDGLTGGVPGGEKPRVPNHGAPSMGKPRPKG